ncbi:MAG: 16S rRNA (guanine(966)-N(2))-methyltransferase RsmD [Desulfobacterota bacterium]|nr:16S rRNA (guanine(966)-N(2))-methyltransferase RsmD [Thermodesulfobacteriota bacterium]
MALRITGGSLKGRTVTISNIKTVRYTSSKVREAIFSMIGDICGYTVLELFAGSGIFSFEALSRGAESATLVEKDERMIRVLERNVELLGLKVKCSVLRMDVYQAIPFLYKRGAKYDIIFFDPPYGMGHVNETLMRLELYPLHKEDSFIIVEHSKKEVPKIAPSKEAVTKKYGDSCVTVFRTKGAN